MNLFLINPYNSMTAILNVKSNNSNKYRIWKPLGLLTIAGLTPPEWNITIFDENLSIPNYSNIKKPDLVGITAFTSQANRAYKIADIFRSIGVPVVTRTAENENEINQLVENGDMVLSSRGKDKFSFTPQGNGQMARFVKEGAFK